MNEEIHSITNNEKTAKNKWKMMTQTFFELYTVYIKRLGQLIFHT